MKSPWKQFGWACKLDEAECQGITRAGQKVLSRLMETQLWCLPVSAHWVRGRLNKGPNASDNTFVWEKAAPLVLALKPDNSIPPRMSLAPFKLLLQQWSSE